jgi:hypothetical protein
MEISIFDFRFSISGIAGHAFTTDFAAKDHDGRPDWRRTRGANRKSKNRTGSSGENRIFP